MHRPSEPSDRIASAAGSIRIIRTRRRTIAVEVHHDATLEIRAPLRMPLAAIEDFVERRKDWIRKKVREVSERPRAEKKLFVPGEGFLYLGQVYALTAESSATVGIERRDRLYIAERALPAARALVLAWYKAEARRVIGERCIHFAAQMGRRPHSISVTDAQKRWGSCGVKGTLNFSWRLVMAPPGVIDYVIVHELAHIGQMNHSRLFWDSVAAVLPDYRKMKAWLRENEGLLAL